MFHYDLQIDAYTEKKSLSMGLSLRLTPLPLDAIIVLLEIILFTAALITISFW